MKRLLAYAVCAAIVVAVPVLGYAADKASDKSGLPSGERKFLMNVAHDNKAEIELGRLASERGSSDAVKQFGQRMVTDHQKATDELMQLAQQKGITLPTDVDAKHKKAHDKLAKLSGADFDRAYMREMAREHDKDVKAFEREAKSGRDADVKAFAQKMLPTLNEHKQQAHQVASTVNANRAHTRKGGSSQPSASPSSTK